MRSCVVCAKNEAVPWTLIHGTSTAVVALCEEHAQPLVDLIDLSTKDPSSQPVPQVIRKHRRKLTPLDWTPPTD